VKTRPVFMNFTSGELTPKISGRIDLTHYFNGVQKMQNFFAIPQGGAITDPGTHFVAEVGNENKRPRLIPFSFSAAQQYIIEAGDKGDSTGYFRFFTDHGQVMDGAVPYEIETPYLEADLPNLRWVASDFQLYFFHPDHRPCILTRNADDDWTISEMDFIDGPYEDEINSPTITPSGTTGNITLTASAALFNLLHVGCLWRIRHGATWGYVEITSYTSSTVVGATVISTLGGIGASDGHREGIWSDFNGWPFMGIFHEGRLLYVGNYEWPRTVWGSKVNAYDTFIPGTEDDDAYSFTIANLDVIRWGIASRLLCFGAFCGEATIIGQNEDLITPTLPPRVKIEQSSGSANKSAVMAGKSILFLQRAGKKIIEFLYKYEADAYQKNDISILADHLVEDGIYEFAFQQEPYPILWCVRDDGVLIGCTFDKQQQVVAWHEHPTNGVYESVAVIKEADRDEVWVVAKRNIDGVERRYIEYFDSNISVHCGLTYSGAPTATISGLDHLIGEEVQIVGDGAYYPPQTVPGSGELTINPEASEIYVGLGYNPILITNKPEVQIRGTSLGLKKRWNSIVVGVLETMGVKINEQVIPARKAGDEMDEAPEPFSGEIIVENLGWDREGRIKIEQPLPLPAHILYITGDLVIGDA